MLGTFGRHNLVVHPRFGSRVVFTAVISDLELPPDPPVETASCTECGLCVRSCPVGRQTDEREGRDGVSV